MNKQLTDQAKEIYINGKNQTYKIYEIDLQDLSYNFQNDRIINKTNKIKKIENIDSKTREELNNELENYIWNDDVDRNEKTLNNIKNFGQIEAGIVSADGIIIDGNRRFTCLRKLHNNDGKFKAVILEDTFSIDSKEIKTLELQIQHGREEKLDYNPINKMYSMYRDIELNEVFTVKEYANNINSSESEVRKSVKRGRLIHEFLDYVGEEGNLDFARDLKIDGPIFDISNQINKLNDEQKIVCFDFILHSGTNGAKFKHKEIRPLISGLINDKEDSMEIIESIESNLDLFHDLKSDEGFIAAKNDYKNEEIINSGFKKIINKEEIKKEINEKKEYLQKINSYLEKIDIDLLNSLYEESNFEEEYSLFKENISKIYGEINV